MKYLILILLFVSCSQEENNGCNCTGKFTTPNGLTSGNYFYIQNLPIDCNTGQILNSAPIQPNAIFLGCQ